jgi:simple sugar transport system permease protein
MVAVAAALLALWLLALQGLPLPAALEALAAGAFGDTSAWSATLRLAAPLLLAATGVLLCFRCGLWNIGAEGQLLLGGLAAAHAGLATGHWLPALVAGALAGGCFAALPAWLAARRGVPEVLTTLMLNGLAIELLRWLVTGPLQEPTRQFPQSATLPRGAWLPQLELAGGGAIHLGLPIGVVLLLATGWFLACTRAGLALRAGATSPGLARGCGFPLERARILVFAAGGAMAGMAGAVDVSGVARVVDRSLAQGQGYAAVAAALLAGLGARWLGASVLLFAALESGTAQLQWVAPLPGIDRFGLVLQGLAIAAAVVVIGLRGRRANRSEVSQ